MERILVIIIFVFLTCGLADSLKRNSNQIFTTDSFFSDLDRLAVTENDLLDFLPSRLANIGPTFILRDAVGAILAGDDSARISSWTSAIMGTVALLCQTIARMSTQESPGDTSLTFLNTTSQLLGVGVGVLSISGDVNNVIKSSRCLSNINFSQGGYLVDRSSIESTTTTTIPPVMEYYGTAMTDPMCGDYATVEYIVNLFAVGIDLVAVTIPPSGPYMAVVATIKTIFVTAFRAMTSANFAW